MTIHNKKLLLIFNSMPIVYQITCMMTGKIYIGWTKLTLEKRWKRHLIQGKSNCYLKNCIKKYGAENFEIKSIFIFETDDAAKTKEIELIRENQLNICRYPDGNGMNMTDGGEGTVGYAFTESHRKKISNKSRGRKHKPETIQKMSISKLGENNPAYGKPTSEKQKQTARAKSGKNSHMYGKKGVLHPSFGKPGHMAGKKHAPETIKKMREKMKGKNTGPRSPQIKEKLRKAQLAFLAKNPHQSLGKKRKPLCL